MPAFILKQPNGLLARFSSVVDNFTHYGMTKEEAFNLCREQMGIEEAVLKVKRALDDEPAGPSWKVEVSDGLNRWRYALNTIEAIHGPEERAKVENEILGPKPDSTSQDSAKEFTVAVAESIGGYEPNVAARYKPEDRLNTCQDDDAFEVTTIEIGFAIPVTVTQEQYRRLLDLVDEITDAPWNTPAEGVHWLSGQGSKPQWSQMDASFLGKPADPNAPEDGEPSFDASVCYLETSARGFHSEKERAKVLRRRSRPRPPSVYCDVVQLAMRQAVQAFGGSDGKFNAAGFSTAFSRIAGLEASLDGNLVRAILCGRPDVLIQEDGTHFQMLYHRR